MNIKKIKNLKEILNGMNKLELNRFQKRELIKGCYSCSARFLGLDEILEIRIDKAINHPLEKKAAFDYIKTGILEHEKDIINSLNAYPNIP